MGGRIRRMQLMCWCVLASMGVLTWMRLLWLCPFAWATKRDTGASDQYGTYVGGLVGGYPQEGEIWEVACHGREGRNELISSRPPCSWVMGTKRNPSPTRVTKERPKTQNKALSGTMTPISES